MSDIVGVLTTYAGRKTLLIFPLTEMEEAYRLFSDKMETILSATQLTSHKLFAQRLKYYHIGYTGLHYLQLWAVTNRSEITTEIVPAFSEENWYEVWKQAKKNKYTPPFVGF